MKVSELLEVVNQVKLATSKASKKSIIENNESQILKDTLQFIYNPQITSGISAKKWDNVQLVNEQGAKDLNDLLTYLKVNNTGRNTDVEYVKSLCIGKSEEEVELIKSIVTKDLQLGISVNSLSELYGNEFIGKFGVKKGMYYKDESDLRDREFILTQKLDGNRALVFVSTVNNEVVVEIKSPSGKKLEGFVEIENAFKLACVDINEPLVFDGEIVLNREDGQLGLSEDFNKLSSICRTKGEKSGVKFVVFDMLLVSSFNKGKSTLPYKERISNLTFNMTKMKLTYSALHIYVNQIGILYKGKDASQIDHYMKQMVDEGKEGLMIDFPDEPYLTKKSKSILKVKKYHTIDLEVVGVREGKNKGKAGAVEVYYNGLLNLVTVGLKDQKDKWLQNPNLIVGKIIEIKYVEETVDGNMRHANILRVREDKIEESY